MTDSTSNEKFGPRLKVSELDHSRPHDIAVTLDEAAATSLAARLGIDGARKVRLTGKLSPVGRADWRFDGEVGATVIQPCVVSLAPVTTRVDAPVERTWVRDMPEITADEAESPDDVTQEPLGREIDIGEVLAEAVALNLPDYPRSDDAELEQTDFTEPGKDPMTDADAKPFAGLAGLRDQLAAKEENGSDDDS
ncbi:MAG TPA: hypothetical protein DEO85_10310 [Maritimibacter sp.]|nr:hypothetical protein [Maritimibacter sp.]